MIWVKEAISKKTVGLYAKDFLTWNILFFYITSGRLAGPQPCINLSMYNW